MTAVQFHPPFRPPLVLKLRLRKFKVAHGQRQSQSHLLRSYCIN
jgi:hypothetical protein